jgi:transposase
MSCREDEIMKYYTEEFKREVAKKHLMPGGKSVALLSKEIGISEQSIRNWIYKYNNGKMNDSDFNQQAINDSEKLDILMESKTITEEKKGLWYREKGLKEEKLKLWEEQLKKKLSEKDILLREENKALKAENRRLLNDLNKKDKALAEISSMLMLKKNYRFLIPEEGK